jgi:hypothetical protein
VLEDRSLLSGSALGSGAVPGAYGQLQLAFEANQGQAAPQVNYLAHGSGYTLSLTPQKAVLDLSNGTPTPGDVLNLGLVGANPTAPILGLDPLITKSNYLTGNNPAAWITNVPNFGQVEYQDVYPGVNLVYHGNQGQLEYDFSVAPGANPAGITLSIQGTQTLTLDAQGNLVLRTPAGDVVEQAPVAYQMVNGTRQAVSSSFVLQGDGEVGFQIGAYDPTRPLVIDPTLSYASYLPGPGVAIAVDSSGEAYVTGRTTGYNDNGTIGNGVFVDKLNTAGTALVYQTFLSSSGGGNGIAVDGAGDAYVTGYAGPDFPTTPNALQPTDPSTSITVFLSVLNPTGSGLLYSIWLPGTSGLSFILRTAGPSLAIDHAGDATGALDNVYLTGEAGAGFLTTASAFQPNYAGGTGGSSRNAFFAQINPNLSGAASLLYGSYLGGSLNDSGANSGNAGLDAGTGIAVDGSGNAYLVGRTYSTNFPTTPGAFQQQIGGGLDTFVAKFNPSLFGTASLVYSTYLGGSGADGMYAWDTPTMYGTNQQPGPAIAVDSAGNAYVAGMTTSANFPTTAGAFQTTYQGGGGVYQGDTFVTKLNPTGTGLVYSTYLGGSNQDGATSVAVDAFGDADVTGMTRSANFPTMNPIQAHKSVDPKKSGPNSDTFVTTLNPSGSALLFSTYLGGTGNNTQGTGDDYAYGLALDSAGNAYVTGQTYSSYFPTTQGALQTTPGGGFVFKIDPPAGEATALLATGTSGTPAAQPKGSVLDAASSSLVGWFSPSPASLPVESNSGSSSTPKDGFPDKVFLQLLSEEQDRGPMAAFSSAQRGGVNRDVLDQVFADFDLGVLPDWPGTLVD